MFFQDSKNNEILKKKHLELENIIKAYHNVINLCNPTANILDLNIFTREVQNNHDSFSEFYKLYTTFHYLGILYYITQGYIGLVFLSLKSKLTHLMFILDLNNYSIVSAEL